MDENKNPAQTSGEAGASAAVGDNAGADKASNVGTETASDASFTDDSAVKGTSGKGTAEPESPKSTPKGEKSSEYARRRREAEQAKAIKEAEEKAIIRALGGINPYTEEEMKDSHDVAEFLEMQEIKKRGGDPLSDFARYRNGKSETGSGRGDSERARERLNKDLDELRASYPNVNINDIMRDERFNAYAEGKLGRMSLKSIYDGFLGVVGGGRDRGSPKDAQTAFGGSREQRASERMNKDLGELRTSYPDVNIEELIKDEAFNDYADGKLGRKSLKEVYEGFLSFVDRHRREAEGRVAQMVANAKASPGALSSAGQANEPYFSFEQVKAMSRSEVHRNYDKIMKSMKRWG